MHPKPILLLLALSAWGWRRPYGDHLILYRIIDETVEVSHVIHGARDYEAILSQDVS